MTLPKGLVTLGSGAFFCFPALESTGIPGSAFKGCSRLEQVILSASVASIAQNAFEDCSPLLSIPKVGKCGT